MALALMATGMPAFADMDAAKAFLDTEIGDMSTLSRADQEKAMVHRRRQALCGHGNQGRVGNHRHA